MTLVQSFLVFAIGLIALLAGADGLVRGASRLAALFGVPPLLVGLTVVSFGTSAPEIAVIVTSSLSGKSDLGLGNVVGSNICNVLMVLGASAMIAPMAVERRLVKLDLPIMIAISILAYLLVFDGLSSQLDGALLFGLGLCYLGWMVWMMRRSRELGRIVEEEEPFDIDEANVKPDPKRWPIYVTLCVGGLVLLVLGSNWLVKGASALAAMAGMSEMAIGLTIVAIGTSLPELATSGMASIKGERDMAIGNVVGSNIFNLLFVLGIGSALAPGGIAVGRQALFVDMPIMLGASLLCLPVFKTGWKISRLEGGAFVAMYLAYCVRLFAMK